MVGSGRVGVNPTRGQRPYPMGGRRVDNSLANLTWIHMGGQQPTRLGSPSTYPKLIRIIYALGVYFPLYPMVQHSCCRQLETESEEANETYHPEQRRDNS